MAKTFKMAPNEELLHRKPAKKEPVWVYLEREMRENVKIKPYNKKVGDWLAFLRDMKQHVRGGDKLRHERLNKICGPAWFVEFSSLQKDILQSMKGCIMKDFFEQIPSRTKQALYDLGITMKLSNSLLLKALGESHDDPGIFFWQLYKHVYKMNPCELRPSYDINGKIIMSSILFIDMDECVEQLDNLVKLEPPKPPPPPKKKPKYYEPPGKYGMYLQKMHLPFYTNIPLKKKKKKPQLAYKVTMRDAKGYAKLICDETFIKRRIEKNIHSVLPERECNYNFWEPPSSFLSKDPKKLDDVMKSRMMKLKPSTRFNKRKPPYENTQFHVGSVAYTGNKPNYLLHDICNINNEDTLILHGGYVHYKGELLVHIQGLVRIPKPKEEMCDKTCNCIEQWNSVQKYMQGSKCTCGHYYDHLPVGVATEKYFHKPTRYAGYYLDQAKIYQLDPREDLVKKYFEEAIRSHDPTPTPSFHTLVASDFRNGVLLEAFLADLANTTLATPHLPDAHRLHNLQEWVARRVKGGRTKQEKKLMEYHAMLNQRDINDMKFGKKSRKIAFTTRELANCTWNHRTQINDMADIVLKKFVKINKLNQLDQARLHWATMNYDANPNKAFLDCYFAYMPGRMRDVYIINPFSMDKIRRDIGKSCVKKDDLPISLI